jgi:phosphatidylglycerophosphate synthase
MMLSQTSPILPLQAFAALSVLVGLGVAGLAVALAGPQPVALVAALAVYACGAGLALRGIARAYPHPRLGLCNAVTLARWGMSAALVVALFTPAQGWGLFWVALIALSLDGVDGWAARRAGLASDFGARFDMEVDAALGLILTLILWTSGTAGAWVFVLGLPRYLFIAASWIWPWMARPLPPRFARKVACVVQMAGLIFALIPAFTTGFAQAGLLVAALVLLWSFARDTLWLFRARHDG